MKRYGNIFIFTGVVLIIGPFFGFTVRGQQMTSYSDGLILAAFSLFFGMVLSRLGRSH